jgi:hypothetical protein
MLRHLKATLVICGRVSPYCTRAYASSINTDSRLMIYIIATLEFIYVNDKFSLLPPPTAALFRHWAPLSATGRHQP